MSRPLALAGFLALSAVACGYHLAARPRLPGGVERVRVELFANETSELELSPVLSAALSERAAREDRLARRGESGARITGRILRPRTTAGAFPPALGGAGLYALSLVVEVELRAADGKVLSKVRVRGDEPFEAGAGPEETEANRRRALQRLAERLADDAWAALQVAS